MVLSNVGKVWGKYPLIPMTTILKAPLIKSHKNSADNAKNYGT